MMGLTLLWVLVVVVVVVFGVLAFALSRTSGDPAISRAEREELERLRVLLDDLKETAWDHRELDSPLSTIIIDKIRTFERKERGGRGELGS